MLGSDTRKFQHALRGKLKALVQAPSPHRLGTLVEWLASQTATGRTYEEIVAAVEQHRRDERIALQLRIVDPVARRTVNALHEEACTLVKKHTRRLLIGGVSPQPLSFSHGNELVPLQAEGWCDGSVRLTGAGMGFLLRHTNRKLLAQGSVPSLTRDPVEAEASALHLLLCTAKSLGLRSLAVYTDAQAVIPLLHQKGRPRLCVIEAELFGTLEHFERLSVTKIPRLFNHEADRLAVTASRGSSLSHSL